MATQAAAVVTIPLMTPLVSPDLVATRLMLDLPVEPKVQSRIDMAVVEAQGKVAGFLNRPLEASTHTLTALYPAMGYELTDPRAWPQAGAHFDDRIRVASYIAAADGVSYDVTFKVGLDVASDPELQPIRDFIVQDAVVSLRLDPVFTAVARAVTSVSAGGQSISYERAGAADSTGASLNLASLRRWKRHAIHQQPMAPIPPWPYAHRN